MKKKIIIILSITVILAIFLIFILVPKNKNNNTNDFETFKVEYEELNGKDSGNGNNHIDVSIPLNNKIKYVTVDDLMDFKDYKSSFILFVGNASCEYCRSIAEIIVDVVSSTKIENIFYLKTDDVDFKKIVDIFGEKYNEDNLKDGAVLFIIDGEVVSYNFKTVRSHKNPYIKLDSSQERGLKSIYKAGVDIIIEDIAIKNSAIND